MSDKDVPNKLSRRAFNKRLALGGAAALAGAAFIDTAAQTPVPRAATPTSAAIGGKRRPNILLMLSDQERGWDDLAPGLQLGAHDWLRERGTSFANYNVHTTPCSPSRATIYTGLHTAINGMTSNIGAPPFPKLNDVPTLGHLMREQGYYTAYKGKWHLSDVPTSPSVRYGPFRSARDVLEPYGFSDYSDVGIADGATWAGYKYDGETASAASQWLYEHGRSQDKPWLLAVNFVNPHDIVFYDDPDRQQSLTRLDRDFLSPLAPPPKEGVYTRDWNLPLPKSWYADDLKTKPWAQRSYVEFCNELYGHIDRTDESRWRRYQSYYYNCIRDVDAHALTVLRTLEQLGLDDNTVVIYTADHGDMLGAHGLRQKGPTMYKENVRVPLIVRHPEYRSGITTNALGGPIDLLPTLLSFAGVSDAQRAARYPALKGVDLTPALADATARTQRDKSGVLYAYNTMLYVDPEAASKIIKSGEDATWTSVFKANLVEGRLHPRLDHPALFRGVHDGRYKYARYFRPDSHHIPKDWTTLLAHNELELYDTQSDPDEIVNLAAQPETHRDLIVALNAKTNQLIEDEIGFDDGREHPGPTFLYRL
jgi:arylsulfatase A-like enzyme